MISSLVWIALGAAFIFSAAYILARDRAERNAEPKPPAPCTAEHPRCKVVSRRLWEARMSMQSRGIVPLLSPRRPAWPRVSGGGVVVNLRR